MEEIINKNKEKVVKIQKLVGSAQPCAVNLAKINSKLIEMEECKQHDKKIQLSYDQISRVLEKTMSSIHYLDDSQ